MTTLRDEDETAIVQFYCDLCELSLELEPASVEMKALDALCEQFKPIMANLGIEFPPPSAGAFPGD